MKGILAYIKKAKWILWIIVGVVVVGLLWFFRSLFVTNPDNPTKLPDVPEKLRAKVEKAEEEALEARIKAKTEADEAVKILKEVASIEDGVERRKRLSSMLNSI